MPPHGSLTPFCIENPSKMMGISLTVQAMWPSHFWVAFRNMLNLEECCSLQTKDSSLMSKNFMCLRLNSVSVSRPIQRKYKGFDSMKQRENET